MKRLIAILLASTLILTSCSKTEESETSAQETTTAATTTAESTEATTTTPTVTISASEYWTDYPLTIDIEIHSDENGGYTGCDLEEANCKVYVKKLEGFDFDQLLPDLDDYIGVTDPSDLPEPHMTFDQFYNKFGVMNFGDLGLTLTLDHYTSIEEHTVGGGRLFEIVSEDSQSDGTPFFYQHYDQTENGYEIYLGFTRTGIAVCPVNDNYLVFINYYGHTELLSQFDFIVVEDGVEVEIVE